MTSNSTTRLLFVQLCALNEGQTIDDVIRRIPRTIRPATGASDKVTETPLAVRVLVIDDGSSDNTAEAARSAGADVVIRHCSNRGLAQSFQHALDECLARGASYIVHLDADGQHHPEEIPQLLAPLLAGRAEVAIGDRQLSSAHYFSRGKRVLEIAGSCCVRWLTSVPVRDAVCGFRAYTRVAASQLCVTSTFSYTLETLVQMGQLQLCVTNVGITSQAAVRTSRLSRNCMYFVRRQAAVLLRAWVQAHVQTHWVANIERIMPLVLPRFVRQISRVSQD